MIALTGKVIHGNHYGKRLGFPTANIDRRDYRRRNLKLRFGVYAGWVELKLKAKAYRLKAGIVVGPLDRKGLPKIEAHLIGFQGNLYGEKIGIYIGRYIRKFIKFKSEEELKKQIKKDINKIKKLK